MGISKRLRSSNDDKKKKIFYFSMLPTKIFSGQRTISIHQIQFSFRSMVKSKSTRVAKSCQISISLFYMLSMFKEVVHCVKITVIDQIGALFFPFLDFLNYPENNHAKQIVD